MIEPLNEYKIHLNELLIKSQDAFERQLSYISAGALALSIGFIRDVVPKITEPGSGFLLFTGWILLALTLLVNCTSHLISAHKLGKSIGEINTGLFSDKKINKRFGIVTTVNVISVILLISGIGFIISFIILNLQVWH